MASSQLLLLQFRAVVRLARVSVAISYTVHLMACFWVLVGRLSDQQAYIGLHPKAPDEDTGLVFHQGPYRWVAPEEPSWLVAQGWSAAHTSRKKYLRSIYLSAYYFCMTTMATVGYGEITPRCDLERTFVVVLEGVGGLVWAMVVASLTSAVSG